MKILVSGNYETDYNRTLIILKGLRELGHEVIEYSYAKRCSKSATNIRAMSADCDFVFMPSFTHKCVPFVKNNITKPLIFDPLISKWLTNVHDYKQVSRFSLKAWRDFRRDRKTMTLADAVISDTNAHADWFSSTFGIPREKFTTAYVGVDCDEFKPMELAKNERFKVGFYGGFIPLQGTLNIINAINLLKEEDIDFEMIGTGYEYEKAKALIKELGLDISLPGWLKYDELAKRINGYDVCLGIFGDTTKANLVIPNKVFHYAACGRPIITKSSPAITEAFTDGEDIILSSCEPQDIADQILKLKNNEELRLKTAKNVRKLMEEKYNVKNIASSILEAFNSL